MKLFIYADPHWSSYSSIVRSRGEKYSTRLENLIKTINWVETEAQSRNCDAIVCLGDFFDKSQLNSEEITALQEISWASIKHYMLVGNHEMGRSNLEQSSSHLFALVPYITVIDYPHVYNTQDNTSIVFLPYILEHNKRPLQEYIESIQLNNKVIILSHNDISGLQMGKFISTVGFSIEEIERNCNLFINGHIHNEGEIGGKIINLGNITGQNFNEDAFHYQHNALIVDTATRSIQKVSNPYAMNFYKVDFTNMQPIIDDKKIQSTLTQLKSPAVATIKINSEVEFLVKDLISTCDNIIECRLIKEGISNVEVQDVESVESSLNHIKKFQQYIYDTLGTSDLVLNELERVSK